MNKSHFLRYYFSIDNNGDNYDVSCVTMQPRSDVTTPFIFVIDFHRHLLLTGKP